MNPISKETNFNSELTVSDQSRKTFKYNNCNKTENALWIFFYMKMVDSYWKAKI